MLKAAKDAKGELRIKVNDQKNEISNRTTAKRQCEGTVLGAKFADDQYLLTTVFGLFTIFCDLLKYND
jgi:hypothetical protein